MSLYYVTWGSPLIYSLVCDTLQYVLFLKLSQFSRCWARLQESSLFGHLLQYRLADLSIWNWWVYISILQLYQHCLCTLFMPHVCYISLCNLTLISHHLSISLSLSLSYVPLPDLLLGITLLQPFQQFLLVVQDALSNASQHTEVLTWGSRNKSRERPAFPSKTYPENPTYSSLLITTHQSLVMLLYLTTNRT